MINHVPLMDAREAEGREASPSAGVIDSQSAKTTEAGGPHGYDAGKKVNGRKPRYGGKGVLTAAPNVSDAIGPRLRGLDVSRQAEIERTTIELDGTLSKSRLGANAIVAVSMAVARTAAIAACQPLYTWLGGETFCRPPIRLARLVVLSWVGTGRTRPARPQAKARGAGFAPAPGNARRGIVAGCSVLDMAPRCSEGVARQERHSLTTRHADWRTLAVHGSLFPAVVWPVRWMTQVASSLTCRVARRSNRLQRD